MDFKIGDHVLLTRQIANFPVGTEGVISWVTPSHTSKTYHITIWNHDRIGILASEEDIEQAR